MIQTFLLIFSLSIDSLVAGLSMGINHIKLSIFPIFLLNGIGMISLALSMICSHFIGFFVNDKAIGYFSTILFTLLGISKIIESLLPKKERKYKIRCAKMKFIFHIYAHPEKADMDNSKYLSYLETIPLGIALSLDNFLIGIGIRFLHVSWLILIMGGFIISLLLMVIGYYLGVWLKCKLNYNISWLSGVLLFILAFWR